MVYRLDWLYHLTIPSDTNSRSNRFSFIQGALMKKSERTEAKQKLYDETSDFRNILDLFKEREGRLFDESDSQSNPQLKVESKDEECQ